MTGADLRAAIEAACDLMNPRLSEVDWDAVAARAQAGPADPGLREALWQDHRDLNGLDGVSAEWHAERGCQLCRNFFAAASPETGEAPGPREEEARRLDWEAVHAVARGLVRALNDDDSRPDDDPDVLWWAGNMRRALSPKPEGGAE